jgi:hypothetical protein
MMDGAPGKGCTHTARRLIVHITFDIITQQGLVIQKMTEEHALNT